MASFTAYMDNQMQTYEKLTVDAVREGDALKAQRCAGAVDMLQLLRLRVLNDDGEHKSRERMTRK